MEAEFSNTPGFFSAAIGGQDNVFDQSFAANNGQTEESSDQMDWDFPNFSQLDAQSSATLHYSSPPPAAAAASNYPSPPNPTVSFHDQPLGNTDFIADFDTNFNTDFINNGCLDLQKPLQPQTQALQKLDIDIPSRSRRREHGHFTPPSKSVSPTSIDDDWRSTKHEQGLNSQEQTTHNDIGHPTVEGVSHVTDQPPKKRTRRSRKRNPPSPEAERQKREKLLERNRVAASKCRQKRKSYTNTLEDKARDLQHRRESLSMLANSLKDEVLFLKGQMLRHTDCGCNRVRDYLNNEADSLACATHSRLMSDGIKSRQSSMASTSPNFRMVTDAECSTSIASDSPILNEQSSGELDF